jgi:hypothetical protein
MCSPKVSVLFAASVRNGSKAVSVLWPFEQVLKVVLYEITPGSYT